MAGIGPAVGDDAGVVEHPRTIVHVDLDCYYAQVEMMRDPERLRGKPVGVQQKTILATTNYIARQVARRKGAVWQRGLGCPCPRAVVCSSL